MRKRQRKKQQGKAYPVLQTAAAELNAFRGRLWFCNTESGPLPAYYIGVDPASEAEPERTVWERDRLATRLRQRTPEQFRNEMYGSFESWPPSEPNRPTPESGRIVADLRMEHEDTRRANTLIAQYQQHRDLWSRVSFPSPGSPPHPDSHRPPPKPTPARPLRRLPVPATGVRCPRSEIGVERNWKEEGWTEKGAEVGLNDFEGRWLQMPVIAAPNGPHQVIADEKFTKVIYFTPRRRPLNCGEWAGKPPAQMSAAQYRQWMIDNEREIDQYRGVEYHSGPYSWGGFWKAKAEGWDYDTWEEKRRKELRKVEART